MKTNDIPDKINEALNYMQNDPLKSIKIFDEILEIEPENIEALNGKGSSLMKLNQLDEAEKYFNQSLSITKTSSALINKGIICKNKQMYDKSLSYYNETINLNPDLNNIITILKNEIYELLDSETFNGLSNFNEKSKELIKKGIENKKAKKIWDALECYQKAVEIDPTCESAVQCLINEIKSILQTEFIYNTPTIDDSEISKLKIKSLRLMLIEENPEEALEIIENMLKKDENEIDSLNEKGTILFQLGEYEKAIECFDKCLNIDKDYCYALFNKALVLRMLNKLDDALECFDELLKTPQNYAKVKPYQLEILDKLHNKSLN